MDEGQALMQDLLHATLGPKQFAGGRWKGANTQGLKKKVVRRRERASKGDSAFSCESANDKQALSMGVAEWVPRVPGWRSPIEMGAVRVDVRQTCCRHIRACDRLGIEYFAGTTGFPPL